MEASYRKGWEERGKYEEDHGRTVQDYKLRSAEREIKQLRNTIDAFTTAIGIEINSFNARAAGKAARMAHQLCSYEGLAMKLEGAVQAVEFLQTIAGDMRGIEASDQHKQR